MERTRPPWPGATRFADIRRFDRIDSTNRWVMDQAARGCPEGLVAVADFQSAGRGRLGRVWEAPAGSSLIVSVLLRPLDLRVDRRHLVTAAVALAAADACEEVGGFLAELKWPNDLLWHGRKLAGVLAEAAGDAVVVGIGMNLTTAPEGAAFAAEAAGRPVGRDLLLDSLLGHLDGLVGRWEVVADRFRAECRTIGSAVRVELPTATLTGVAEGVDDHGRLLVRPEGGGAIEVIAAGDVVHLRPAG